MFLNNYLYPVFIWGGGGAVQQKYTATTTT
jgi:hypothetical protein